MRSRGALGRGAVVVAWVGAVLGAIALEDDLSLPIAVAATLLAGALIDRWWALAVPWGAFAIAFAVGFVQDPDCSDCGEDPWDLQLLYGAFLFALPGSALMACGLGVRRLARPARRGSPPPARRAP